MVSHVNHDLVPPFSESFQLIEKEWHILQSSLNTILQTSAFSDEHDYRNTFTSSFSRGPDESVPSIVISITEVLEAYSKLAEFFDRHAYTILAEVESHLEKYRSTLWFFKALDTLYHPTEEEKHQFAFFQEGEWNGYDLSFSAYRADKERIETRGKTKNPNFVPRPHVCCTNCICFYDDTPEYEWYKEDKEESLASNNIRINWSKRCEFEREFLQSGVLETMKSTWSTWMPKEHWFEFPNLELCKEIADKYRIAVKPAVIILRHWLWKLPSKFYFSFLWQNRHRFRSIAEQLRLHIQFFQQKYSKHSDQEDTIVEAARQNVRILPLKNCFEEIQSVY